MTSSKSRDEHETSPTLWSSVRVAPASRGGRAHTGSTPAPEADDPRAEHLSREQLVDRILAINPSATTEFLDQFEPGELGLYLRHLLSAQEPRGAMSRWARPNDAPSIWASRRRY